MNARPQADEYAPFYAGYVERVPEADVLPVLAAQVGLLQRLPALVPPPREGFAYAPGKWTVRQVVGHLGDAERVFGFRAFAFSRGDATPLPGFDETVYVERSPSVATPLADLVAEFVLLREANLQLFRACDEARWRQAGVANGNRVTVRALAFLMAGHVRHHAETLAGRYGIDLGA